MTNPSQEIRDTLSSPGAKLILHTLRKQYRFQWRKLRTCRPEEVLAIQAAMNAIDALPIVIEALANKNMDAKKDKDTWFRFMDWLKRIGR